jgi:hypothetical protein
MVRYLGLGGRSKMAETTQAPVDPSFPNEHLPVIYADFVFNAQPQGQVMKMYLGRTEPSLNNSSETLSQPVAQVVMPLASFLNTAIFFEQVLKWLVSDGYLSEDEVGRSRKAFDGWAP